MEFEIPQLAYFLFLFKATIYIYLTFISFNFLVQTLQCNVQKVYFSFIGSWKHKNYSQKENTIKVCLFLDGRCAILSFFQIVVIFSNTSANFVLISAYVLLKMNTVLKELRIAQLGSINNGLSGIFFLWLRLLLEKSIGMQFMNAHLYTYVYCWPPGRCSGGGLT